MNELEGFAEVADCPKIARALRMVLLDYLGRYAVTGYSFELVEVLPDLITLIDIVELAEPWEPPPGFMAPE